MRKTHLLVIDPQVDFCDPKGSLFVAGADKDMQRLTKMVDRIGDKLTSIHVTLDSHHLVSIFHPAFWIDKKGKHPGPFTLINAADVENGVWSTTVPSWSKRAVEYVKQLAKNGRYLLCVWPPHCLIGSNGYQVNPDFHTAIMKWSEKNLKTVDFVTKGSNPWTEHYSAVVADVPDPSDPSTQINIRLIKTLMEADEILIAGEASSHCLANTVRDIANNFGDDSYVKKLTLIEDGTSAVGTFEKLAEDFVKEMKGRGMKVTRAADWMV